MAPRIAKRPTDAQAAEPVKRTRTSDNSDASGADSHTDTLSSAVVSPQVSDDLEHSGTDGPSDLVTPNPIIVSTAQSADVGSCLADGPLALSDVSLPPAAPSSIAPAAPLHQAIVEAPPHTSIVSSESVPSSVVSASSANIPPVTSAPTIRPTTGPTRAGAEVVGTVAVVPTASSAANSVPRTSTSVARRPGATGASAGAPSAAPLVEHDQVKDYPEEIQTRINVLSAYDKPERNAFAVAKVPRNCTWGNIAGPTPNADRLLCNPHTGSPVTILICGRVVSATFVVQGSIQPLASMVVLPPSRNVSYQAVRLISGLSNPPATMPSANDWHAVRMNRWQQRKLPDGEKDQPTLFDDVYDGQEGVRPRSAMSKLSPTDIRPRDVVLVETRINKYNTKDNNRWITRAQYEILSIVLLYSPPSEEEADSGQVNDADDVFADLNA
ncbi:hypothetical protein CONPUDRAFT_138700 [Coniophora puteana RWD-64-598 SS2]|uniref:Uncharacterized protein n=1 Tax=Coniophora puteana (strain RWD-64-598) TaxID=741705 RepID=A0A5M3MGP7_CONPW|nr:uncharacterized protein CONPUDRAFT_138700 [Coniophora puteana RWD-64-598 SS2]EIW78409.1 hypothetical protein CONPUDRAFT_138700 [Coniophora puteana RWD-64-598 SS2]